jgi:hypothetical protein
MDLDGRFVSEEGVIWLDGFCVIKIAAVGEPTSYDPSRDPEVDHVLLRVKQWRGLIRQYDPAVGAYVASGTWDDAFWRSLVGNIVFEGDSERSTREADPKDDKLFQVFFQRDFEKADYWLKLCKFMAHD